MVTQLVLVRHGETEWSRAGRHTSLTDLPLMESGRAQALAVGRSLTRRDFSLVMASPRQRALATASIALPETCVLVSPDLEPALGPVLQPRRRKPPMK
jgi:probable phosphoglycerate mutase